MRYKLLFAAAVLTALTGSGLAQGDDSILSDEYILAQDFVEAKVLRVRPLVRTLTVQGNGKGDTREFKVPESVRITVRGKEARLRDVRRGDIVLLTMIPANGRLVASRLRIPETDLPLEVRQANPNASVLDTEAPVTEVAMAEGMGYADEDLPATLPATASLWPLVWLTALGAFLGALFLRVRRTY